MSSLWRKVSCWLGMLEVSEITVQLCNLGLWTRVSGAPGSKDWYVRPLRWKPPLGSKRRLDGPRSFLAMRGSGGHQEDQRAALWQPRLHGNVSVGGSGQKLGENIRNLRKYWMNKKCVREYWHITMARGNKREKYIVHFTVSMSQFVSFSRDSSKSGKGPGLLLPQHQGAAVTCLVYNVVALLKFVTFLGYSSSIAFNLPIVS